MTKENKLEQQENLSLPAFRKKPNKDFKFTEEQSLNNQIQFASLSKSKKRMHQMIRKQKTKKKC